MVKEIGGTETSPRFFLRMQSGGNSLIHNFRKNSFRKSEVRASVFFVGEPALRSLVIAGTAPGEGKKIWNSPIARKKLFSSSKSLIINKTAKEMFAKIWRKQTFICKNLRKKLGRSAYLATHFVRIW